MNARKLLEKAKIGDIIKFDTGAMGLVIYGGWTNIGCTVNEKAILLTHHTNKIPWMVLAHGFLSNPAKIMKGVNCIVTKGLIDL